MNEKAKDWLRELEEHKAFINSLELYVCECLDYNTSVENIKKSLCAVVDHEVRKLRRVRKIA